MTRSWRRLLCWAACAQLADTKRSIVSTPQGSLEAGNASKSLKTGNASLLLHQVVAEHAQAPAMENSSAANDSSVLQVSETCYYVPPEQVPASQGYRGMEQLNDPNWSADRGQADGRHVLFYAYGKLFDGRGQIGAWKYNENTEFIEYWYSKSHCMGMCSDCCSGGNSNIPGVLSKSLNPSADQDSWFSYWLKNKFAVNTWIDFGKFGKFRLMKVGDNYRLQKGKGYLAHIYTCSTDSMAAKYRDKDDNLLDGDPGDDE